MLTGWQKLSFVTLLVLGVAGTLIEAQGPVADPANIARILAARYPAQPIMSYIPALSWSGQLRLAALTGETKWRDKALSDIAAFTGGRTPAIAEPYRLTSLAGALAFSDAASFAGDKKAGALAETVATRMVEGAGETGVHFARGGPTTCSWRASVLSRGRQRRTRYATSSDGC